MFAVQSVSIIIVSSFNVLLILFCFHIIIQCDSRLWFVSHATALFHAILLVWFSLLWTICWKKMETMVCDCPLPPVISKQIDLLVSVQYAAYRKSCNILLMSSATGHIIWHFTYAVRKRLYLLHDILLMLSATGFIVWYFTYVSSKRLYYITLAKNMLYDNLLMLLL